MILRLVIDGNALLFEETVVNLGVIMNSSLTWNDHISLINQTIFCGLRSLKISASLFSEDMKMGLVRTLLNLPHNLCRCNFESN